MKIRASLTRRDKLIRERMFTGWTQADAERDADELLAREKVRDDLDARARDLAAVARRLQSKEDDFDARLTFAKARLAVQPVSLTQPPKAKLMTEAEIFKPWSAMPEWRDDPEEACAA